MFLIDVECAVETLKKFRSEIGMYSQHANVERGPEVGDKRNESPVEESVIRPRHVNAKVATVLICLIEQKNTPWTWLYALCRHLPKEVTSSYGTKCWEWWMVCRKLDYLQDCKRRSSWSNECCAGCLDGRSAMIFGGWMTGSDVPKELEALYKCYFAIFKNDCIFSKLGSPTKNCP